METVILSAPRIDMQDRIDYGYNKTDGLRGIETGELAGVD